MKFHKFFLAVFIAFLSILTSCESVKVERVEPNTLTDLDGYWNDNDVRMVCENLVRSCVASPLISTYYAKNRKNPIAIIGSVRNESDEHIDTAIVANYFRNAVINSGVIDFVSSSNERGFLRAEREDQQINSSPETVKAIRNETGADFMLLGSVRTVVQTLNKQSVRAYFVNLELHDLETNRILWSGEDDSIKKVIKRR